MHALLKSVCLASAVAALSLSLAGCESEARYIDSGGTETIVTVGNINIQDWNRAADEMIQSLLTSGALEEAPSQPAVLAISRIVNNTTKQVDTSLLTKRIRVALNQSGKVRTTTTMGLGGNVEDPLAKGAKDMAEFYEDDADAKPMIPDFSLSGRLIETRARAGNVRQATYSFQMSLTDVRSGLAIWEEDRQITKQGSKPAVGW